VKKRSIRRFILLPAYQFKIIGLMLLVMLFGLIFNSFLFYRITLTNVADKIPDAHSSGHLKITWDIIKPAIIVTNSISFVAISIMLFVLAVVLSHRIIGPLLKISGYLKKLADGKMNTEPVKLRETDEGKELCDAANNFHDKSLKRFKKLDSIRKSIEDGELVETADISKALKEITDEADFV